MIIGATKLSDPPAMHAAQMRTERRSARRGSPEPRKIERRGIRLSLAIACRSEMADVVKNE